MVCTHYNHHSCQGALSRGAGLTLALYLEGSFMVIVAYTPGRHTDFLECQVYKNFVLHLILYELNDSFSQESSILPFKSMNLFVNKLFPTL